MLIKWNGLVKALEEVERPSVLVPFLITCGIRNSYCMWQPVPSSLKPGKKKYSSNETLWCQVSETQPGQG